MSYADMVREFMEATNSHREEKPGKPPLDVMKIRHALIKEEYEEYQRAHNIVNHANEIADLIYVLIFSALSYGIDNFDEVFAEVHRVNMKKINFPVVNGKIQKPEGFEKPNIAPLLGLEKEPEGWN